MARTYLVAILLFVGFASLLTNGVALMPDADAADTSDTGISLVAAPPAAAPEADLPGQSVLLERSGDGHFYANVEVNGATIEFLVDTGASSIALSREDARRAGLATSIAMPTVVGEGASGAVHGEVVMLDRVTLGSATESQVPAIVLDSGSKSLLGQSFLSKFGSVEIRGDRMILQ